MLDMKGNLRNPNSFDSDEAIDDFLSKHELVDTAYRNGLLDEDMAYDAFSYDLERALRDARIREYIAESRREESDLFDGVLEVTQAWRLKFPAIVAAPRASVRPTPGTNAH
jgi:hypothetical protein